MSGRVVVVGSLNVDLVTSVTRHPRPGETVAGRGLSRLPGGKGANQALAAARAGASVSMVGRVGDDADGTAYVAGLAARGVDVAAVRRTPGAPTGHALITVDEAGENTIVVVAGANAALTPADVDAAAGVIGTADVVLLQLEVPPEAVAAAARAAHDAGVRVVLTPAPWAPLPAGLADSVDVWVANEHEARDLRSSLGDVASLVTTLGARGAVWDDVPGSRAAVDAPVVRVVDTTGAGDAFTGALAAALADGATGAEALRRAVVAGAAATRHHGAQNWSLAE